MQGELQFGVSEAEASIVLTLMHDVQGSGAVILRMFEKVRAAGRFAKEDPAELAEVERMLRGVCGNGEGRCEIGAAVVARSRRRGDRMSAGAHRRSADRSD